ncbi:zinc ribbon domain-containing protein [Comamonas sp. Tr-654]|uniref:zinc ribbon domain-containing protein n=1 Tax=Comamonas sp. Tr-654 TaxID=2608341 RepID=UPI0014207D6E|nr:zinc ribbon domain-containing protein [Comamonas sp. Tr-654]NIF81935.1 zinc ribbon domain-containing protein [Comamonas sp. Tr-654]
MNCSQCGNPLSPNAKFCKNCGTRQAPEAAITAVEKICSQCQAVCKPDARFCTRCGMVFESRADTDVLAAAPQMPSGAAQAIDEASLTPPLIEPMDQPAPRPPLPEPAAKPAPRNHRAPAFPQEPVRGSNAWIKWAVLALLIAAIAGGVMMASNMRGLTGTGSSANSASGATQAGKDAISAEDKAKADALVGPLGGNTAAQATPAEGAPIGAPATSSVDTVPATAVAPVVVSPDTVSAAPAPAASPQLPAAPASGKPPVPPPARTPPVKKSTAPSLDDLLD